MTMQTIAETESAVDRTIAHESALARLAVAKRRLRDARAAASRAYEEYARVQHFDDVNLYRHELSDYQAAVEESAAAARAYNLARRDVADARDAICPF